MTHASTWNVYFDGLCPLCSREIDHYRKQRGAESLRFVDITAADFNAEAEGVDPIAVHKEMHVKTSDGRLVTGVDAFIEIWKVLPRYGFAARLAQKSFIKPTLDFGYHIFAAVRPYLPRKAQGCEASPYCEIKKP